MGFLQDYAEFCNDNESPGIFHIWSSIAALSNIVSRRVWIGQGIFTVYANMYIVLVGSPGCGKSTAMNIAKGLIRDVKDIPIAASQITKEALTKEMSDDETSGRKNFKNKADGKIQEYTPMAIFATELVHFLAVNPLGMIEFFTTIYDEPVYEVKTKNKGNNYIIGPYITLLGCMTPDITTSFLKANIISGGFARRTVFVWAGGREKAVPFPEVSPLQKAAWNSCVAWANKLKTVNGEFTWDPEAKEMFRKWYINLRNNISNVKDPMTAGYFESKHVLLLKTAMIVALSDSVDLVLRPEHFTTALALLEMVEKNLSKVFEGTGRNELHAVSVKILDVLDPLPEGMPVKRLLANMYREATREDLLKILTHLVSSDRLERHEWELPGGAKMAHVGTPASIRNLKLRLARDVKAPPQPPSGPELKIDLD